MKVWKTFLPVLTFVAAALLFQAADRAWAEDWRKQYPEINLGVITSENEADRTTRYKPVREYLEKELGVKEIKWRTATDYAGVIEGVKAKKIELARFGPASYAQCWLVTNNQVEPLVSEVDEYGTFGYYSVIIVKTDSKYQKIEDLKGVKFAFADPNSTSGFQAPKFFMSEQGIDADKFFGSATFSGSHENSVMGLLNGTFEAVATFWHSDNYSNPKRMEEKGMIKPGQWRIVWKSPMLPNNPWAMPLWLPKEMREDVKQALLTMKDKSPEAWKGLTDGKIKEYRAVTHSDYDAIVRMIKSNLEKRAGK